MWKYWIQYVLDNLMNLYRFSPIQSKEKLMELLAGSRLPALSKRSGGG